MFRLKCLSPHVFCSFGSLVSQVVHRFRQGGFNTLVSTCVGEEGLDIGEVDLIVCFDAQKNPIRLVQRMGRTGRKRQGHIVVILAEGREERVSVKLWTGRLSNALHATEDGTRYDDKPDSQHPKDFHPLCSSDVQPEPEQQAQRVQVHHWQEKLFPPVPQQPSHASPGRKPRRAQDAHQLRPV